SFLSQPPPDSFLHNLDCALPGAPEPRSKKARRLTAVAGRSGGFGAFSLRAAHSTAGPGNGGELPEKPIWESGSGAVELHRVMGCREIHCNPCKLDSPASPNFQRLFQFSGFV
ncbi:MAG TPA: hypothetical protein VIM46_06525, partial [Luteolibacter sp.]